MNLSTLWLGKVVLVGLFSGTSAKAVIANSSVLDRWVGSYGLTAVHGKNRSGECGQHVQVEILDGEDRRHLRFSMRPSSLNSFSVGDDLKTGWSKRDDWDVGFVQKGGRIGPRYAYRHEFRATLAFAFLPMIAHVGEFAHLSDDGRRLRIRFVQTTFGVGPRQVCDYERLSSAD